MVSERIKWPVGRVQSVDETAEGSLDMLADAFENLGLSVKLADPAMGAPGYVCNEGLFLNLYRDPPTGRYMFSVAMKVEDGPTVELRTFAS